MHAPSPALSTLHAPSRPRPARRLLGLLSLALLGCPAPGDPGDTQAEPSSGGTVDPASTGPRGEPTTTDAPTGAPGPTTGTGEPETGTSSGTTDDTTGGAQCQLDDDNVACDARVRGDRGSFAARPTPRLSADGPARAGGGGPVALAEACDVFAQDCPAGQKCNPYADDGGPSWNATGCFPLAEGAGEPGDPCSAQGTDGPDSCEAGAHCRFDAEKGFTCVALCGCSADNPTCGENERCLVYNNGVLPVCLPMCDPFVEGACPEGQLCAFAPDSFGDFFCFADKSGELGQLGDPCQTVNGCDPGFSCEIAPYVPGGCKDGAQTCCTPLCDVDAPDCPAGSHCVEYFGGFGLEAPVCLEDVGYCVADDARLVTGPGELR